MNSDNIDEIKNDFSILTRKTQSDVLRLRRLNRIVMVIAIISVVLNLGVISYLVPESKLNSWLELTGPKRSK